MVEFRSPVRRGRKNTGMKENPASPRSSQTGIPDKQNAGLPDGPMARLRNISRGGILIETPECMMPGGIVYVRLVAADAVFLLRGRVLRSRPSLMRHLKPIFESAVSFDWAFPRPVSSGSSAMESTAIPAGGHEFSVSGYQGQAATCGAQRPTTYTVTASVPRSGPDLNQIFGLNNW